MSDPGLRLLEERIEELSAQSAALSSRLLATTDFLDALQARHAIQLGNMSRERERLGARNALLAEELAQAKRDATSYRSIIDELSYSAQHPRSDGLVVQLIICRRGCGGRADS